MVPLLGDAVWVLASHRTGRCEIGDGRSGNWWWKAEVGGAVGWGWAAVRPLKRKVTMLRGCFLPSKWRDFGAFT
jgi:hypothetical protein